MKLSSPWVHYYRQLEALFAQDDEVRVTLDDQNRAIKVFVEDATKADAMAKLLPETKTFGNVELKITVVPANKNASFVDLLNCVFRGNPALRYIMPVDGPMGHFDYAVMERKVVQFFNDDMSDLHGVESTLYEDIAQDVFRDDLGVFFCTEVSDNKLEKPLGEWP